MQTCVELGLKECDNCKLLKKKVFCWVIYFRHNISYNIYTDSSEIKNQIMPYIRFMTDTKRMENIIYFKAAINFIYPECISFIDKALVLI